MFTDLSIIIVNWNLKDDTLECISSLIDSGATSDQIILVDNGSTDGTVFALREKYGDRLRIIEMEKNLGYAAGANQGIQLALKLGFQWLLLLNNDTIVATNFCGELQQASLSDYHFSIISPMILYHSKPTTIWSMGDRQIDRSLLTTDHYKNQSAEQNFPAYVPIDFTNGCAMLVHRRVFDQVGLLDESFFMYGEEVDFCWRARQAGFKFACYPAARIWHKISKSSGKDNPAVRSLKIKNQVRFYRRYSNLLQKFVYFVYTLFRVLVLSIVDVAKWRIELLPPTWSGWLDGWFLKTEGVSD